MNTPRRRCRRPQWPDQRRWRSSANSIAEGITLIQNQLSLGIDEGRAFDRRVNFVAVRADSAFKHAADNALLPPDLPFAQFAFGVQTSEFGARARAARRPVVGFARTEDKVPAVHVVEL